jgi:hypothetical protein
VAHKNELPEKDGRERVSRPLVRWLVAVCLVAFLGWAGHRSTDASYLEVPEFLPYSVQSWLNDAHDALHTIYFNAFVLTEVSTYFEYWQRQATLLPDALMGDAEAQFQMGKTYNSWHGVRDRDTAHTWYVRAAENGHAEAAIEAELYYLRLGEVKNYAKAVHWAGVAARLDPDRYGSRHRAKATNLLTSKWLVEGSSATLQARTTNPLADIVLGTLFRDCPQCPEMIVVPGVDGGVPFAVSRRKISLADVSACIIDSMCFYDWPSRVVPDSIPSYDPMSPLTVSGTRASNYSDWLFQKTGHRYRLPSVLEWEWIASAGQNSNQTVNLDQPMVCQGWNEPGLGDHDWVGDIVRGQGPGVYPPPKTEAKPNPFGLCDLMGPLGELTVACDGPQCAEGLHKHYDFVARVLTKTADGDIVQLGRHYVGTGWFLTNYNSDSVDASVRLVRMLPDTLHNKSTEGARESRHE